MGEPRYCPTCGDEFEPYVASCPDCGVALVDQPAPEPALPEWADLETIAEHINLPQAELLRTALGAEGIPVHLQTDDCGGMRPHFWLAGVKVQVRSADALRARAMLGEIESGGFAADHGDSEADESGPAESDPNETESKANELR